MMFQVLVYVVAILLAGYLIVRCFGPMRRLSDDCAEQRRWTFEQAAEYERRKAVGEQVGSEPRMPWKVAMMLHSSPFPMP